MAYNQLNLNGYIYSAQICWLGYQFPDTALGKVQFIGWLTAYLSSLSFGDPPVVTDPTHCLPDGWAIQPYSPLKERPTSPENILSNWQARRPLATVA